MTHKDIYTKFMIEYDKANVTSSYPSLTEYEVATILDRAYLALIAQKVTGNNIRRSAFEADIKSISDLQPLIKHADIKFNRDKHQIADNVVDFSLPNDFMYYVSTTLDYKLRVGIPQDAYLDRSVPTILTDHSTAQRFFITPYNMPWVKLPVCYVEGNRVYVVYDSITRPEVTDEDSAHFTYLKKPKSFVLSMSGITHQFDDGAESRSNNKFIEIEQVDTSNFATYDYVNSRFVDISMIQELYDFVNSRMREANLTIMNIDNSITNMIDDRITNITGSMSNMLEDITALKSRMTSAEANITVLNTKVGNLETGLLTINVKIGNIELDITRIKADYVKWVDVYTVNDGIPFTPDQGTTPSTPAPNNSELATLITTISSDLATLRNSISTLTGRVSVNESNITTNTNNISTLTGKVTTNTSNIASNIGSINSLNSAITRIDAEIALLKNNPSSGQVDLTEITNRIAAIEEDYVKKIEVYTDSNGDSGNNSGNNEGSGSDPSGGLEQTSKSVPYWNTSTDTITLTTMDSYRILITGNNNFSFIYNSSNPSYVSVSNQGQITPIANGQSTITVTSIETDAYYSKSVSFIVVVDIHDESNESHDSLGGLSSDNITLACAFHGIDTDGNLMINPVSSPITYACAGGMYLLAKVDVALSDDFEINISNSDFIQSYRIDDWGYIVGRPGPWIGGGYGNNIDPVNVTIKSKSDDTLSKQISIIYRLDEDNTMLLSGGYTTKTFRVPYTTNALSIFVMAYPYTFDDIPVQTPRFTGYSSTGSTFVNVYTELITSVDFIAHVVVPQNTTGDYRHEMLYDNSNKIAINIIQEPYAEDRIYYSDYPVNNEYMNPRLTGSSSYDFVFNVANSMVLTKTTSIDISKLGYSRMLLCIPKSLNLRYSITIPTVNGYNPTSVEYTWGSLTYIIYEWSTFGTTSPHGFITFNKI